VVLEPDKAGIDILIIINIEICISYPKNACSRFKFGLAGERKQQTKSLQFATAILSGL